jgi:hypothetical protein
MESFLNWQFVVVMLLFASAGFYLFNYIRRQFKGGSKGSCDSCNSEKTVNKKGDR